MLFAASAIALAAGYSLLPSAEETVFHAVAVSENGDGVVVDFSLKSTAGSGRLLVNVRHTLFQQDTEYSLQNALSTAKKTLGVPLTARDYTIDLKTRQKLVGGESATAVFAVAIIANYLNKPMRSDSVLTASLDAQGNLLPVGGVDEKIIAAVKAGKKFFYIARSQELKYEQELSQEIQITRLDSLDDAVLKMLA